MPCLQPPSHCVNTCHIIPLSDRKTRDTRDVCDSAPLISGTTRYQSDLRNPIMASHDGYPPDGRWPCRPFTRLDIASQEGRNVQARNSTQLGSRSPSFVHVTDEC